MRPWLKVLLITLVVGMPAFLLGPVLWPPSPDTPEVTAGQLLFFMILFVIEALLFGLGVAFILFGLPLVRQGARGSKPWTWAAFISIAWLLVSWWPHDNLHVHAGNDIQLILLIEYGFHFTLIIAALMLASFFVRLLWYERADTATAASMRTAGEPLPTR